MATPSVTNILRPGATLWYAPTGEANPDETSVVAGAAWGGNWAQVGYTRAPLTVVYEVDTLDVMIEEKYTAVKRFKTGENLTFETTLAEVDSTYLSLFTSGTVTTTAAGVGQRAYDQLTVGGEVDLDQYAWGFEGTYVNASNVEFPVRLFMPIGTGEIAGALEFGREDYPGIPIQIKALADDSQSEGAELFTFQRVTAIATDE